MAKAVMGPLRILLSAALNISDVNPALNPNLDQVQVSVKNMENGAKSNWKKTPGAAEFIIYRDNNEVGRTSETFY